MDAFIGGLSIQSVILAAAVLGGFIVGGQILLCLWMMVSLQFSARERNRLTKEMFGLLKKIEGLTSSKRERMLRHYDGLLQSLSLRLPPTIAAEISQQIIDTETQILKRVAELDPNLRSNVEGKKKLEELIHSMEGLERSIVSLTSDTVKNVMLEGRKSLFHDADEDDQDLAA